MAEDVKILRRRMERAEAQIEALKSGEVDAVVGRKGVTMLRLREIEEALRESERFANKVLDADLSGIYIFDVDQGLPVFINRSCTRITGHTLEGLRNRDPEKFFELFHPEERKRVAAHIEKLRNARDDEAIDLESRFQTADGRWIWCLSRNTVFSRREDGAVREIIGSFQDITERVEAEASLRESEDRFRSLTNGLPLMVWVHDTEGRQVFINQTYARFFGVRLADVGGSGWQTLLHPEDGETYTAAFFDCVKRRRSFHSETRARDADGRWRWLETWARPRYAPSGEFLGYVGATADIEERKRMEVEIAAAGRRKDEFLAMLGHELRNPLAAITTALQVARKQTPDAGDDDWPAGIIERQTEVLRRLVDDLLDVSRITRGKIAIHRMPVEIGEQLRTAVLSLESAPEQTGRVTVSSPPEPVYVSADPARLQQVFANLLTNAVKYSPGGGEIRFSAEIEDGAVLIRCRDHGVGIPPEKTSEVFETFTQLDTSLDRESAGLGIGLALVKSLVEMHGGAVSAVSEGHGKGAEFRVVLPTIPRPRETEPPREPASASPGRGTAPRRLLIAEDNADLARSLTAVLETAGHTVRVVHDGNAAVSAFAETAPDAAVIDIGLPGLDGYGVAEAIRKGSGGGTPVLVGISGYARDAGRETDPFDRYMVKPVDTDELLRFIEVSTAEAGAAEPARPDPDTPPRRVLLIEDHPALGTLTLTELQTQGYEAILCVTGEEGVEKAADFRPDIVLCDLRLPGMNGVAVARKLREMEAARSAFIVALTASRVSDQEEHLLSAGFDRAVEKPLEPEALEGMVAEHRRSAGSPKG